MVRTLCVLALVVPVVVSCSGGSATPTAGTPDNSPSGTATGNPSASASGEPTRPPCPNPEGAACLGTLTAGTYKTTVFHPAISYTVPDGWKNFEDTPGNFLLVPPDGNLPGVNGGTSDFIGIYTSVAAPNGCKEGVAPGSLATVGGWRKWATQQAGFRNPHFRHVSVGGLSGVVVDLRLPPGWSKTCSYSAGLPVQPMITGLGVSGLDHNILPGQVTRLYLLDYAGGALAIEVVDIKDAHHLSAYSDLVSKLQFGT